FRATFNAEYFQIEPDVRQIGVVDLFCSSPVTEAFEVFAIRRDLFFEPRLPLSDCLHFPLKRPFHLLPAFTLQDHPKRHVCTSSVEEEPNLLNLCVIIIEQLSDTKKLHARVL